MKTTLAYVYLRSVNSGQGHEKSMISMLNTLHKIRPDISTTSINILDPDIIDRIDGHSHFIFDIANYNFFSRNHELVDTIIKLVARTGKKICFFDGLGKDQLGQRFRHYPEASILTPYIYNKNSFDEFAVLTQPAASAQPLNFKTDRAKLLLSFGQGKDAELALTLQKSHIDVEEEFEIFFATNNRDMVSKNATLLETENLDTFLHNFDYIITMDGLTRYEALQAKVKCAFFGRSSETESTYNEYCDVTNQKYLGNWRDNIYKIESLRWLYTLLPPPKLNKPNGYENLIKKLELHHFI